MTKNARRRRDRRRGTEEIETPTPQRGGEDPTGRGGEMTHVGGEGSQAHIAHTNVSRGLWFDLDETPESDEERNSQLDALAFRALRELLIQTRDKRTRLKAAKIVYSRNESGPSFADVVADLLSDE